MISVLSITQAESIMKSAVPLSLPPKLRFPHPFLRTKMEPQPPSLHEMEFRPPNIYRYYYVLSTFKFLTLSFQCAMVYVNE